MKLQIIHPCSMDWNNFDQNKNGQSRFCSSCQKDVHDITGLNQLEIYDLYQKHNENLCIRATSNQVTKSSQSPVLRVLRKIGTACFIVLSSFFTQDVIAQGCNADISQTETTSDSISIKGVAVGDEHHSTKSIEKIVEVVLLSEEGLVVKTQKVAIGEEFHFSVPKKLLGNAFVVRVTVPNYRQQVLRVSKIKNTSIKFNMQWKRELAEPEMPPYILMGVPMRH